MSGSSHPGQSFTDRQADPTKGEMWHLDALGIDYAEGKQDVRNTLVRLAQTFTPMQNPKGGNKKRFIKEHLGSRIEEFPRFVRDSHKKDADRTINLLYQVFIKGRNNAQKNADYNMDRAASRHSPQRRRRTQTRHRGSRTVDDDDSNDSNDDHGNDDDIPVSSPAPWQRKRPRSHHVHQAANNISSRESARQGHRKDPDGDSVMSDVNSDHENDNGDAIMDDEASDLRYPDIKPPAPAIPSPGDRPRPCTLPSIDVEVYRPGQPEAVGITNTVLHIEAGVASEPRCISHDSWVKFLVEDCRYKSGTEDVYSLGVRELATQPINTANRLRMMLLKTKGQICRCEIRPKDHLYASPSNPASHLNNRNSLEAKGRCQPRLNFGKERGESPQEWSEGLSRNHDIPLPKWPGSRKPDSTKEGRKSQRQGISDLSSNNVTRSEMS